MRMILDPADVERAFQSFMQHLKNECVPALAEVRWRGGWREHEVWSNAGLGFWFAHKATANRHWLQFGQGSPAGAGRLDPVCEMSFPFSGFGRRMNGFFARFGNDVLVAGSGKDRSGSMPFTRFLELHGYDLTTHAVKAPDGKDRIAVVLSSISSPALAYNVSRYVRAVDDYAQWAGLGLLSGKEERIVFGTKQVQNGEACPDAQRARGSLHRLVVRGVREQLEKFVESHKLRFRIGSTPACDIVLTLTDNTVLAAFQVKTGLSPAELYTGIGQLLLSRSALRAAKFLVVPGTLGPFFTQALFRHDIHATPYKLTPDMGVVLDAQAVFAAVRSVG